MQYILTEEEYTALKAKQKHEIALSTSKLQTLCTKIANEMPVLFWSNKEPKVWGCGIKDPLDEWYCDCCPVEDICPRECKSFSQ